VLRARAPLRVSFAGGGTDVPPFPRIEGGAVLSATISSFAYSTLRPRNDNLVTVKSLDFGLSVNFGIDDPIVFDGELDLPKAAISRVMSHPGARRSSGFDLFLHTNAPPGSGLGSSSAVVVCVVGVVAEHCGLDLTSYEIAEMACLLEREDLGISGGLQDQYAAAFGGFNFMEFTGDEVLVNPLRVHESTVRELEHNMLLAYTGRTRFSDHIIEDQVARFEAGEPETLTGLRAQRDLAVVGADQLAHDGKPDTRAARGPRARAVAAPEAVEHAREVLRADPDARVADLDHRRAGLAAHGEDHAAPGIGVAQGVGE